MTAYELHAIAATRETDLAFQVRGAPTPLRRVLRGLVRLERVVGLLGALRRRRRLVVRERDDGRLLGLQYLLGRAGTTSRRWRGAPEI